MIVDSQLVIGPYEANSLGEEEILRRLTTYLDRVPTRRLLIWNTQGDYYFDRVLSLCHQRGVDPYLWHPVLADRKDGQRLDGRCFARSAAGYDGWGKRGRWEGLTGGDERFLFSCPAYGLDLAAESEHIASLLERFDFAGVFLDRIRYPSPANGIEQLFSCFCPACSANDDRAQLLAAAQGALPLLASLAKKGALLSWEEFLEQAGLQELQRQREETIVRLVRELSTHINRSRYKVALDLFSPSLAPLVGQSYQKLAEHCDWMKAMTYAKAEGPATLVLECKALIDGLRAFAPKLSWEDVAESITTLLGHSEGALLPLKEGGDLINTLLSGELLQAQKLSSSAEVICGIELVDHPLFVSQISSSDAKRLLGIAVQHIEALISCWNLLYIPLSTLPLLLF